MSKIQMCYLSYIDLMYMRLVDNDLISINKLLFELTDEKHDLQRCHLMKMTRQNNAVILVARDIDKDILNGPNIVGMGIVNWVTLFTKTIAYIDDVVVDPDPAYRRRGIGEKILLRLIDIAKDNDAECIDLTSKPKRIEANNLYLKHGFVKRNDETNIYRLKLNKKEEK